MDNVEDEEPQCRGLLTAIPANSIIDKARHTEHEHGDDTVSIFLSEAPFRMREQDTASLDNEETPSQQTTQ